MATKGAVTGGVLLAGGGAGGGYAAYKYANNTEETENSSETTDNQLQPQASSKKKIEDYLLSKVGDGNDGKPITKLTENNKESWWKKAHHRYYLEISEDSDEINGAKKKDSRDKEAPSKLSEFKTQCQNLLGMEKDNPTDEDADIKKAKKWCVTYKTLGDTTHKDKKLEEDTNTKWDDKYTTAEKEDGVKKILAALKSSISDGEDSSKKKKAIHKWCEIALDASEGYQSKDKVSSLCVFKS